MRDWTRVTTDRLVLSVPQSGDTDELHALHADPSSWRHYPSLRHTERAITADLVARALAGWGEHGLGSWVLRLRSDETPPGDLVGIGGCTSLRGLAWNLGYRLDGRFWGRGLAQELIVAARLGAEDIRPDLPVVARLLEHNTASRRAAERAGLEPVWSGRDAGNPDPSAVRSVFADRPVSPDVLTALAALPG